MKHLHLDGDQLVLWAESPDEARNFLSRVGRSGVEFPAIDRIFVAKKSSRSRSNTYVGGEYYTTSDDSVVDVFDQTVIAPRRIVELVQWCTCDVMLSRGSDPVLVLEDTTHIVRMNLYQRFPRLARAAMLGVPGLVLQGTRGLDFTKRGDRWALFRYLQAFEALSRIHRSAPSLPITYLPDAGSEREAELRAVRHAWALLRGDNALVQKQRQDVLDSIRQVLAHGVDGSVPPDIPSIDHSGQKDVIVRVGAKPDKKSWREKGSGQMDPYVGLIAAAKYIYCYNRSGQQTRDLVVEYTYLPPNFWFFRNPETNALYKTLPRLFADRERWLGDMRFGEG